MHPPLSRSDMRQTLPDPPNLPCPTRRCEERERAPRSSTCIMLVVVETAGPVAGVIREVVRLRSAVEEVVGDVLHDVHRLAAGHRLCSAGCDKRSELAARTSGESKMAWRWSISMPFSPRTARGCNPRCVYQRQRPRGLERPCLSRWLETGYGTLVASYLLVI